MVNTQMGATQMTKTETRWYGVSSGNGNDGVSHLFADYYVRTDDPWRLAECAIASEFKPEYQCNALEVAEIDGDPAHTISAVIFSETDVASSVTGLDEDDLDSAFLIVDVFPVEHEDIRETVPAYNSLTECFDAETLALCAD